MTRVFIAEKPSMAEAIALAIGGAKKVSTHWNCANGDIVTWCFGHLMEQAPPESYDERAKTWALDYLPLVPGAWRKYVKPDAKKQFEAIRGLVKTAKEVVNAGDPDREGNLLVDEVLEAVECKSTVKRIWLLGLDETNVKKALASMKPNAEYRGYSHAAEGRGRADWMIGMNFTRGFTIGWQNRSNTGTLHVGRVQTPTLWMVVMRDREIENFKPIDYYLAKFRFNHQNGSFIVTWSPREGAAGMDAAGRIIDKRVADDLVRRISGADGTVAKLETKRKKESAPLPFSLAALQKEANRKYGFSPDQVLDICQDLYEKHKMTTYPRSDCGYLPETQHGDAAAVIGAVKACMGASFDFKADLDLSRKSAAWDDAKVSAHHGIIPTANKGSFASLDDEEKKVYLLVVRNYLAQFCADYLYDSTSVVVEAGDDREQFTANGKVDVQLGWRTLFGGSAEPKDEKEDSQKLPDMVQGDHGSMEEGKVDSLKTKPPSPYNGASLIDAMENAHKFIEDEEVRKRLKKSKGIGTEATRASIVANLVARGYIDEVGADGRARAPAKRADRKKKAGGKTEKTFYRSSPKGRALIDSLPDAIKKPDLTAYFEDLLHQVQEGEMSLEEFTSKQSRFVTRVINEIKSGDALVNMPTGMTSPGDKGAAGPVATHCCIEEGCTGTMKRRQKTKDKSFFWVCENDHFADDKGGAPVPRAAVQKVEKPCPACGGELRERNSPRGKFLGCANYPKCNYTEDVK